MSGEQAEPAEQTTSLFPGINVQEVCLSLTRSLNDVNAEMLVRYLNHLDDSDLITISVKVQILSHNSDSK